MLEDKISSVFICCRENKTIMPEKKICNLIRNQKGLARVVNNKKMNMMSFLLCIIMSNGLYFQVRLFKTASKCYNLIRAA